MSTEEKIKDIDPRKDSELAKALALVCNTVDKQYVSSIEKLPIFKPLFTVVIEENTEDNDIDEDFIEEDTSETDRNRSIGSNVELVELERFVFDEDEKIQDKLISVYCCLAH